MHTYKQIVIKKLSKLQFNLIKVKTNHDGSIKQGHRHPMLQGQYVYCQRYVARGWLHSDRGTLASNLITTRRRYRILGKKGEDLMDAIRHLVKQATVYRTEIESVARNYVGHDTSTPQLYSLV